MRPAPSARLSLSLAALLGAAVVLPGCRPGTALHNRFNNFRAYYNTYYNASESLDEGETALERQAVTVDRNRLVSVFPVTESVQQGSGPFQDAIDKSAQLLRDRPSSKWADDALLVIGKAYFYQRNLVGAEQKFRETMQAAAIAEDRRLEDEARFWLGRTYAAGDRFEEGVQALEEGIQREGGDQRWVSRMELALGELYARAGRWDEAAEALREAAPREGDDDVAARAYVLLGQVEEHAERWDEAAAAYGEALRRRPAYELGYAARVGRALVIGLEAGRPDEGLEIVRAMRSDDKNYDRRGELALVEARLRAANGEDDRAFRLFRDVLYEPTLAGQNVRGEAHYRIAEFYRDARADFVRASAHLDTAATAIRAPDGAVRPTRGAILDVADEARTYAVVAEAAGQIADADSLLALGALSEEAFEARIAEIEAERLRVYREEQRRLQEARDAQEFRGGGVTGAFEGQQPAQAAVPVTADAGFLAYRAPASLQAGRVAFEQTWGDRPLVPNWRREAAIAAGDVAADRGVVGTDVQGGLGIGEGPPPLDLDQVPRTPAKRAELEAELAGLRYALANALFLSLGRADTAAALYRTVLEEAPDLPVAVRARYALAEIERAAGREDAARPLYEAVAAADSAQLGRASRVRLGLEAEDAVEEVAEATPAFEAARRTWRRGRPLEAALALVALADADPNAAIAPRAYIAAAAAYVDWAGADSTALVAAWPDSLVSRPLLAVADSISGAEVEAALLEAQNETARAAAGAAADSIGAPDTPSPDGLDLDEPPVDDRGLDDDLDLNPDGEGLEAPPDGLEPDEMEDPDPAEAQPDPADDDAVVLPSGKRIPGQAAAPRGDPPPPAEPAARSPGAVDLGEAADLGEPDEAEPEAVEAPAQFVPLAPVDSASYTLRHHLRAVVERYPEAPEAERAIALVGGLPDPAPFDPAIYAAPDSAAADSVVTPVAVGVPADSTAVPTDSVAVGPADADSLGLEARLPPDPAPAGERPVREERGLDDAPRDEVAVDEVPVARRPADEAPATARTEYPGLRGAEPVDPGADGVTWRVRTLSIADEADDLVEVLRGAGFRVGVLRELASGAYAVVVGQFESAEAAGAAEPALPAWARLRGEVVPLSDYEALAEAGEGP